jgi:hypothetical protein
MVWDLTSSFNYLLIPYSDAMFLRGLREGGVPIKFASWHTFIFNVGGTANTNALIQERSRSVKAYVIIKTHLTFLDCLQSKDVLQ